MVLRQWRLDAGMTQAEVSRRTGIHRPIVARLESGRHLPSLKSVCRLARATGGDPAQVFRVVDLWLGFSASEPA